LFCRRILSSFEKAGGHLVYASVAQAFSSDHEPFCLKGPHIDHEQRIDRQPYLNESQAFSMMRDVLAGYEMRTGVQPKRVVVHRTSMYHCEEEEGFREAERGIVPGCDLVWLRQTTFRLVRKGSEEPWRGTLCRIGGESYLFTSGYVPWWDDRPGTHIPVQIGPAGDTDIEARAREILTLSKMNWNSSDGITQLPVTLLFAKRVGEIRTALSDNVTPNPSFRFHT
jgi:argonaute-like protein implicated in RNA metabolism and viral defense